MHRSSILTDRQQQELNKAILQYLEPILSDNDKNISLHKSLSDLLLPSDSTTDVSTQPITTTTSNNSINNGNPIVPNYLEKKWSTVLRLQRKIIDLENEVSNLRSIVDGQLSASNGAVSVISKDRINWLPLRASKKFNTQTNQLVLSCKIHPVLPTIFGGCSDGSLIIWNVVNDDTSIPEKIIKAHTRSINKLAFSKEAVNLSNKPEDSRSKSYIVASCSADLSIKIWDSSTYKHLRTLTGHDHTVSSVAFSRTTPHILYSVSRDKSVKIWDLINGYCLKSFVGHSEWVRDIDVISVNSTLSLNNIKASHELGDFIVTCSNDQSVRLSHAESGTGLALLIGHSHVVEKVAFLPSVSNIIVDKYLKDNFSLFPSIPQELLTEPLYSSALGYKYCISAGRDNLLKLWLLPPPTIIPHRSPLPAKVNDSQGWPIADFIGHQSWVKAISIHPNGRFIFSGSDDKTIKIWDLSNLNVTGTVKCVSTLNGHEGFLNDLDFARYNSEIISENGTKGKEGSKAKTPEEEHEELMKFIESRMRCLFISGGADNSIRLWS
ncbi:WD40-repeat-containing domain protein [Scheffersomyces xylosifermentans]|uniref:WD40-repeat-containing domain protein n=1 Tax=Scheffersomyces xylosifermentans TaxID=1304137 RepID=UPI00315C7909